MTSALAFSAGTRWWREEGDPHASVKAAVDRIKARQSDREYTLLRAVSLYGDYPALGLTAGTYRVVRVPDAKRLSYNLIASVADTLQAEVIQSRPRPMFLTSEGDWEEQERAKQLSKYCEGLFYQCGLDATAARCALDALVVGTGVVKVFAQGGKVHCERVMPWDLFVDDRDGYHGKPRTLYQTHWIDRDVLVELYPDHEAEVLITSPPDEGWRAKDSDADLVLVTEAWHLPSGPESKDGRHVVTISNATLVDEEWSEQSFPFAFLRWKDPLMGFWGASVAEALDGLQVEVNRLARDLQMAQYLHAAPLIFVPRGSRVVKTQWTNDPGGRFVDYDGPTPPTVAAFAPVSKDTYTQLDRHYQRAYELIGVSQMAAQSLKPAGVDSGIALRTYLDNQSKRFILFARAYETFHIDVARLAVAAMRRLAEDDSAAEVVYKDGSHIEKIRWADVDLDESSYILHVFPISALANTPAGRLQQLQELFNTGLIDRDMFLELSNFPDFESQRNLMTAPRELIEKRVYQMLRDGDYYPPNPFMNLQLCLLVVGLAYQRAELQGVPEERLELLRRFLADTQALLAPPAPDTPPAPPGDMPPGDMPPGDMPPGDMPPGAGPPMPPEGMPAPEGAPPPGGPPPMPPN